MTPLDLGALQTRLDDFALPRQATDGRTLTVTERLDYIDHVVLKPFEEWKGIH